MSSTYNNLKGVIVNPTSFSGNVVQDISSLLNIIQNPSYLKYDLATLQAMYNEVDVTPMDEDCFIFDESTGTITGLDLSTGEKWNKLNSIDTLVIPFVIKNVVVKAIGANIFNNQYSGPISKIRLPNSLKRIEDYAFSVQIATLSSLVSINIPTSCEYIGACAFDNCAITEVITPIKPNWELEISNAAFRYTKLNNIDTIIDGIKEIPKRAFYGCERLKTVTVPESVDTIGFHAFGGCENLTIVTVLNPFTTLSDNFCESSVIIRGYSNSTAQTYAEASGNPFIAIDEVYIDASEVAM